MGIAHPHTRRSRRLAQGESLRSPRLRDPPTFSSVLLSSPAPCLTSPPKLPPPQALHGAEFQHHLVELRKCTGVMPYTALLKEFQRTVPDATEADATRVCDALASAGAVLKQGTLVYLRPDEVAEALRRALPADIPTLQQQLAAAQAELATLEEQRSAIGRRARWRVKAINYSVFGALVMQWAVLFRLTYWELSWDVMEPVGFFTGGLTSVASFAWFLKTRQDFTFETMHNRFMTNYEVREPGCIALFVLESRE